MKEIYVHNEEIHNLIDPEIIIPEILRLIQIKSVIDFGCGIGTFLKVCKLYCVEEVMGVDGPWVDKNLLLKNINIEEFTEANLIEEFLPKSKFDLAICLEVAEHIPENSADLFIKNLVSCSDVILFSAAIPGQIGQNHINEQWPNYWVEKFDYFNYSIYDIIRPLFWENEKLSIWYRQNMFLFIKNGKEILIDNIEKFPQNKIINIVHPNYFLGKVVQIEELKEKIIIYEKEIEDVKKGHASLLFYLKIITKYFLRKIRIYNK